MPGAINNEDYSLIDVSKGIYKTNPVAVPDGYAYNMRNLVIKNGIAQQRYPIAPLTMDPTVSKYNWWGSPGYPPVKISLLCEGGAGVSDKLLIAGFVAPGSPRPYLVGIMESVIFNNKPIGKIMPVASLSGALAVYNETLYVGSTTGVFKFDVVNFPTALVETAIPSSPVNLLKIITHKSRLFGFAGISGGPTSNRLYFTDAPAVGTLPETWNPTVNFIDFNGPGGKTTIWDIVSINNYIYVFTDNGLFSLYTSGAPSNWIVRLVNPNVSVRYLSQVVTSGSLIYYVTEEGVFVTDGFDFRDLSQQLTEHFKGILQLTPSLYSISIYDAGLLLRVNNSSNTSAGKFYYTATDKITWTEITFTEFNNYLNVPITDNGPLGDYSIFSFDGYDRYAQSGTKNFLIITHNVLGPGLLNKALVYQSALPIQAGIPANRDTYYTFDNTPTITGTVNRNIVIKLETKELVGSNYMRLKFFKEFVALFGSSFPFNLIAEARVDGKYVGAPYTLPQQIPPDDAITLTPESGIFRTHIPLIIGLMNVQAHSLRISFSLEIVNEQGSRTGPDCFYFSLLSLGYTTMLERSMPAAAESGSF